ncbi:MAG: discoidin domain-containing protein, partial [Terriglobus roseus]|nr:discoidin domain-containing protein [Terriglobus roseus]
MTAGPADPEQPSVIVIRTHYLDDDLLQRAEALRRTKRYEVLFAIDERQQQWDSQDFGKVSLTRELFAELRLYVEDPSFLWRFGDYVFYAVRRVRPRAGFVWLIENDVALDAADPAEPFLRLDRASGHDLLASHVGPATDDWFWHRSMASEYGQVRRCFFPVVRLSGDAIDHLYDRRVADAPFYLDAERDGRHAPNDEVFVATVLEADGFSSADLNQFGDFYSPMTLNYATLFNSHALPRTGHPFHHAALSGERYLSKLRRLPVPDLQAILGAAENDPAIEIGRCEPELWRALGAVLPGCQDTEQLIEPGSAIGRTLALAATAPVLEGIARCLVEANKEQALSRLKRDHAWFFAGRPGPFRNVALRKPATQSSTCSWSRHRAPDTEAAGANDGDTLVECGCHTDHETDPWWQVALSATYDIHAIEIRNREHMAGRLAGFQVAASRNGLAWSVIQDGTGSDLSRPVLAFTYEAPVRCRFLRLTIPGEAILHIVEFSAF